MTELPCGAIITPDPVAGYAHLKEPFRSKWIQCITCSQVPTETVYKVHIPSQVHLKKWRAVPYFLRKRKSLDGFTVTVKLAFILTIPTIAANG